MLVRSAVAALLSASLAAATGRVSYDGYKVFRVSFADEQADTVREVVSRLSLTTWKGAPRAGRPSDIVVPPAQVAAFEAEAASHGFSLHTMHQDLGASIATESDFHVYAAGSANKTWFNSYHSYADHLQFLSDLQASAPANTEIVTAGKSLNGNSITGIHIFGSAGKSKKPAVVFHGTVHAREWIGTMVTEYLAWNLLTNYGTSAEITSFVDKYDFYIFPVVNPDGFLYTQTTNRLWRKNRQSSPNSSCVGHDINRNWAYKWDVAGGASTDPCAEDYKGVSAGDTPEAVTLSSWLKATKAAQGLKLFIDYHSYSQLFMTPYGYSCDVVASNNNELQSLASGAVAAIAAVHGTGFDYGPICTTIYPATGSSVDYVNDVVGSDYTFTSELRDQGNSGFVLPPKQILPSGEEAYGGVRYLLQNMK